MLYPSTRVHLLFFGVRLYPHPYGTTKSSGTEGRTTKEWILRSSLGRVLGKDPREEEVSEGTGMVSVFVDGEEIRRRRGLNRRVTM